MFENISSRVIPHTQFFPIIILLFFSFTGCTSLFARPLDKLDKDDVEDIDTVCLETNVSVPWYEDGEVATLLENLFESIGLAVLDPGDNCDLKVNLAASGRESKERGVVNYYSEDGKFLYSKEVNPNASVEGELIIALQGYQPLTHTINKNGTSKWDVPFLPEILDKLAIVWGDDIYRKAILETDLVGSAVDSLTQRGKEGAIILAQIFQNIDVNLLSTYFAAGVYDLGPDALAAVPFLIETLDKDHPSNNNKASSLFLLQVISGENFGDDPGAWMDWWEGQQ